MLLHEEAASSLRGAKGSGGGVLLSEKVQNRNAGFFFMLASGELRG